MTRRPRPALLIPAAVLLLGVAACGSSTSPPAASSNTTAPGPAAGTAGASPAGYSCAQVGGVFVAHGTDGRGDCEPADPRPACHVPPAQQGGNYLAVLTMTPPFLNGTIDNPSSIGLASNADCWKDPTG